MDTWLTVERCRTELEILNPPGKRGPPFRYPPSLIMFICTHMADDQKSYRRETASILTLLELLGLPTPTYSTVHKSEGRFFGSGFGYDIIGKAGELMASRGIHEDFDPRLLIHTGCHPEYEGSKILVDSQAKQDLQDRMDEEAETLSRLMEATVFRPLAEDGRLHIGAVDGSGAGISGPGIYFEFIWKANSRRFIKHHAFIDVSDMQVIAFAITMEKPGDALVFRSLVEGTIAAGVEVARIYADGAYDTRANWTFVDEEGLEFFPNLNGRFDESFEYPRRNEQKRMETEIGKRDYHVMTGYNIRWLVEVFFSVFKKLYGDKVRNRKFERMVLTMRWKYQLYHIR